MMGAARARAATERQRPDCTMRRPVEPQHSSAERTPGTVENTLFGGRVRLLQPRVGYRVNVDTLLLAHFAAGARQSARMVVDLGSGVGALALAFAHLANVGRVALVERDATLTELAEKNLASARVTGAVHVADLEHGGLPRPLRGVADVVVSNPPFFAASATRPPLDARRRAARTGPLGPFLEAAAAAMGRRAHAFFAYPAPALPELLAASQRAHLVAKRLRLVHAFASSPARLVLVELRQAKPGGLVVEPPLVEWAARGERAPEVAALLEGASRHRRGAAGSDAD
jgi:tRNA1Val (adenine37-N6)-methyltransferase